MKKICIIFLVMLAAFGLIACTSNVNTNSDFEVEEDHFKSGSDDKNYIELSKIKDNIWVHTSYENYNGYRTPSNGMLVITSKGIVLVDTPWNNGQTKELLKLVKNVFKKDVTLTIITHAHVDRIGGIDTLLENGIEAWSTSLTAQEAEKNGFSKPQPKLDTDPSITMGNVDFEIFYPGEGHSVDNITVWLPQHKVLFGGCIIKSLESKDLGSTTDANIQEWPSSVEKVLEKYSDAEVVVPGHGNWGDVDLIEHTIELLEK
ncbi:MAG: subclass B1 metallo-beta-lactamase [Bacillota bacterium]